jgi:hypothetical protein
MQFNDLFTTITQPTRTDPVSHTQTCIDTTMTTITQPVLAGIVSPPITDHETIYTIIKTAAQPATPHIFPKLTLRQYMKQQETIDNAIIEKIQTEPKINTSNPETATTALISALEEAIHPYKKKPPPYIRTHKPWITPEHRQLIRKQHSKHLISIQQPSAENTAAHKKSRNLVKRELWRAKAAYYAAELATAEHSSSATWQTLHTILPQKKASQSTPNVITYNQQTHTEPQEIANSLNDHFTTIGARTAQTIPQQPPTSETGTQNRPLPPLFQLHHTTTEKVQYILRTLDITKATDIYNILPALLRSNNDILSPIIANNFNNSVSAGTYPTILTSTRIAALYKAKDNTLPANYRPISLLPIIGKIFDKLINEQLMTHLLQHNLLHNHQYAFRPQSDTTAALTAILDDITDHKSHKRPTLATFIDMTKAYDTISHTKLLYKLKHSYNFSSATLDLFTSYFHQRTQSTQTPYAHSDSQTITHGIPQGSTLSTTLFIMYINDVYSATQHSTIYTYADDLTLITTADSTEQLQKNAQADINNILQYLYRNNLVPNASKTTFTTFYPAKTDIQLSMQHTPLKHETSVKLLGIYIDNNLKHHTQISKLIAKLQPAIHTLKHVSKVLPLHTLRTLYHTLILPHLTYAITIWGTSQQNATYMQPLHIIQKKIIRIITRNPPQTHTAPLRKRLRIMTIFQLYEYRTLLLMQPHVYPPPPQPATLSRPLPRQPSHHPHHNANFIFVCDTHQHSTRYAASYKLKHTPHNHHSTTLSINTWNSTPADITKIKHYHHFKKRLLHHYLPPDHT